MIMVLLHDIVLLCTWWDDMHYVGLNYYMMKVVDVNEVIFTCYVYVWNVEVCDLMKGLLSMLEVMGFHMYIELVN